jgi:hypothetical protein
MVFRYFIGHVLVPIKLGLVGESIIDLVDPVFGEVAWWIQGLRPDRVLAHQPGGSATSLHEEEA